ncbi:hypothetical protein QE152_g9484 [Popillia japonica]|uniref:Uncharacterized protein n=1 Tax=Popillia japonica TaxID=7064 RepID=A0AAW1LXN3_POPJA
MLIGGRNKVRSHVRDCNSPTGGRYLGEVTSVIATVRQEDVISADHRLVLCRHLEEKFEVTSVIATVRQEDVISADHRLVLCRHLEECL